MKFNRENAKRVLIELYDLMDNLDLDPFLLQGTALGAYRDGDFVPTEKDIDIGFFIEHLYGVEFPTSTLLMEFITLLELHGFELQTVREPFSFVRTLVVRKHQIKTDIVGMMPFKDTTGDIYRFCTRPKDERDLEPYSIVHLQADLAGSPFGGMEMVEMFGREMRVPLRIETYLRKEYGDDWRTPTEDHVSRTRHYNFVRDQKIPTVYKELVQCLKTTKTT